MNKKLELQFTDMWNSLNLVLVQAFLNHSGRMFPAFRKWSFNLWSKLIDSFQHGIVLAVYGSH